MRRGNENIVGAHMSLQVLQSQLLMKLKNLEQGLNLSVSRFIRYDLFAFTEETVH
jgi:hypothetical protein